MSAVESITAIGELNRGERLSDSVSSPEQDTDVVPDDVRAFVIQTLADLPEERVSSAKQFQLLKTQERLIRATNIPSVPRLPYELIANVAQHLQDEISAEGFYFAIRTLAKLNRTSRAVHEVTLPYLYAKTRFATDSAFARSVSNKVLPSGWKYTKHLYLTDKTLPLIQQHYRFHHDVSQTDGYAPWNDVDLTKMFPRIELVSVVTKIHKSVYTKRKDTGAAMIYEQYLRVVLFKPVTIDDLQSLRLHISGNIQTGAVCMFGIQMVTSFTGTGNLEWLYVSHITDLTVCPGAGILAPSLATIVNTKGAGLRIDRNGGAPSLSIEIQNPFDDSLTRSTISLILDLARAGRYSDNLGLVRVSINTLSLRCTSPVLKAFDEVLASGDLPTTNLRIAIEGDLVTRAIVQEHLEGIAETYSRGWYYDPLRTDEPFVGIDGSLTVPSSLAQNLGYGSEQIDIATEGTLWQAEQGFTSSILTHTNFWENNDPSGGGEYDHIKAYLCDHVPVPEDW